MRHYILTFLLFSSFLSFSQKAEIVPITSYDRVLRGELGDNNAITMYLKVAQSSDNVGYIYSVKGWYQYNKIGTPIPLVGFWTGSEVHLFVSEDDKFNKNLLNFIYEGEKGKQYLHNFMYDMESFSSKLPQIKERFHLKIEQNRIQGDWKSNGKRFWVSMNSNNGRILNEVNYIKLPNGKYFDLSNLGIPSRTSFEVIASANNSQNLILNYAYQANLNYSGRCGGAATSGKIALVFNEQYALQSYTDAQLENCYRDLTVDDLTKVSETVTKYKTFDYSSSTSEEFVVDTQKATIVKTAPKK
ncbi:MAG: hypothetical protein CMB99_04045 [Flavobacteriaceae bacterium]|nr:hypothetical protein [Flavobacteriaceae bacterium]|tara:strand:+ start:37379 stop:38281 length:903 start_codon:yes stop_codon:yes gene_type:complete